MGVVYYQVLLDCGAVQADALTVDRLASLEKVAKKWLFKPLLFFFNPKKKKTLLGFLFFEWLDFATNLGKFCTTLCICAF